MVELIERSTHGKKKIDDRREDEGRSAGGGSGSWDGGDPVEQFPGERGGSPSKCGARGKAKGGEPKKRSWTRCVGQSPLSGPASQGEPETSYEYRVLSWYDFAQYVRA